MHTGHAGTQRTISRGEQLTRLAGPALLGGLLLSVYRPLWIDLLRLPTGGEVQHWFFAPDAMAPIVFVAGAIWLLWRRRPRLRALPAHADLGLAGLCFGLAAVLLGWARLSHHVDLLLPSLAAVLAGLATARRGRAGLRAILLPVLLLLVARPLPPPLRDELVWQLQLGTASASTWLLNLLGQDVVLNGVVMEREPWRFTVIESCSGLRGIGNLTLVALFVRELFAGAGPRLWLLLPIAPLVGFCMNVARVALIASSAEPMALGGDEGHAAQGVLALCVGTSILYGLGLALGGWPRRLRRDPSPRAPDSEANTANGTRRSNAVLAVGCGVLLLISFTPPTLLGAASRNEGARADVGAAITSERLRIDLPLEHRGWSGRPLRPDFDFVGDFSLRGNLLLVRYEREGAAPQLPSVELFVGVETRDLPASSQLLASKLLRPGNEWSIEQRHRTPLGPTGHATDIALVSRASGTEHALVHRWRLRDEGLARTILRALLALPDAPKKRGGPRTVIRLATPLESNTEGARTRAERRLERFLADFETPLAHMLHVP